MKGREKQRRKRKIHKQKQSHRYKEQIGVNSGEERNRKRYKLPAAK